MFLPTTQKEVHALGWDGLDVILVTGDTYIDSPYIGVAVIGKILINAGYRVGIIAQPDMSSDRDIGRLGQPALFWGVTAGCMDSMIANYTPTKKPRKTDDLTAGGQNNRRPDRAAIAYTNLIRRYFKNTAPVVLGGIEASLRRISHYDFWSNSVRRCLLFDAKADVLVYGMGEKTVLDLAGRFSAGKSITDVYGICYIAKNGPVGFIELPAHDRVKDDPDAFQTMFARFCENSEPPAAHGMIQRQDTRYLIHNPPQRLPDAEALDRIYEAGYERDVAHFYRQYGTVRALDTIRFSITTHRGCYGHCHFCAISAHQGSTVVSRSEASIVREAEQMTRHPDFKGIISDAGGPTANMYGIECERKKRQGPCRKKRCLTPSPCRHLPVNHEAQLRLLKKLRNIDGVKKVFIGSGIRHDMIIADESCGDAYLEALIRHHISGQLKIAPEHAADHVLKRMGKPEIAVTRKFIARFYEKTRQLKKKQYLTCYFIAAYPGCTMSDMYQLKDFVRRELKFRPEQVQIFTPSPSTVATLMYHTRRSFPDNRPIPVETDPQKKQQQKQAITGDTHRKKRS